MKNADSTYTPGTNLQLYQVIARQLGGEPDKAVQTFRALITTNAKYAQAGSVKLDIANELVQILLAVQQATLEKYPELKPTPAE